MKLNLLFFLASILLLSNCVEKHTAETPYPNIPEETPETLQSSSFDFKLYGRWNKGDLIDNLYNEALDNNDELKALNEQIMELRSDVKDTLNETLKYESLNNQYWKTAASYMTQIEDSILRTSTLNTFKELEDKYYDSMKKPLALADTIEQRKTALNDRVLIMKLFISQSLIRRYQKNEFPDEEILQRTIKTYDELIDQTAPYTKLQD